MPYSVPSVVAPPPPTPVPTGRPGHRRSYTFDQTNNGPGAFSSLGALPRRTPPAPPAGAAASPRSPKRFHFRADDEDSSSSSDEQPPMVMPAWAGAPTAPSDDDDGPLPPVRFRQQPAFRLTAPTARNGAKISPPRSPQRSPNSSFISPPPSAAPAGVPFPRTGSPAPSSPHPVRPPLPGRASSHPVILLANGKPLKSSLKSSRSAPHVPSHAHIRARSAPSTPSLSPPTPGTPGEDGGSHDPAAFADALGLVDDEHHTLSPSTPKAVHFPEPEEGLESVRVFKRTARPASVSFPLGVEDETETETDTDSGVRWIGAVSAPSSRDGGRRAVSSPLNPSPRGDIASPRGDGDWKYVLEAPALPRPSNASSMVVLESLSLEGENTTSPAFSQSGPSASPSELLLRGTLIVRNAAFEKHVHVRFTLDDWCTTCEVGAKYVESLPTSNEPGPGWDRFGFSIRLSDYAPKRGLVGRELVLVARFSVPWVDAGNVGPYVWCDSLVGDASSSNRKWLGTGGGGQGEWWDNNDGRNYRVGFKAETKTLPPAPDSSPVVNVVPFPTIASAPGPPPSTPPPATPVSPTSPAANPHKLTIPIPPPAAPSLRNYAAPAPRPNSWAGSVTIPANGSPVRASSSPLAKQSPDETQTPTPPASNASGVLSSVALHWPWATGRTASDATDVPATPTLSHAEEGSSESDGEGSNETPPTSPLGAAGLLGLPEVVAASEGEEEKEAFATAPTSPLPSSPLLEVPTPVLGKPATPSPPTGAETTSSLYQAFVRQWCFAGAGPGASSNA
ncbi:CBM21 domain-containing protein [Mycena kentingensis (nom. inval.)]|nr:CBM21 domain-containing protein [Mycena kentingensis (nom. inval.)]